MFSKRTPIVLGLFCAACAQLAFGHADDPKAKFLAGPPPVVDFSFAQPGFGSESGGVAGGGLGSPVILASHMEPGDFGTDAPYASDCWGYTSPSGREYAIVGLRNAVSFVDITTPTVPVVVETFPWVSCIWYDMKVFEDHAYVVTDCTSSMRVYDMSAIDSGTITLANTVIDSPSDTHNVVIDTASGFLFRTGGSAAGVIIYDLNQSKSNPPQVAYWPDRYVHDAWAHTYTSGTYANRQILICNSGFNNGGVETGLDVLDVTDKDDILLLDRLVYAGGEYSHQGCMSEDGLLFYMGDEQDQGAHKSFIIDLADLENVSVLDTFSTGLMSIDHNQYVRGRLIFQANYSSGLRVFDATDPLNPVVVGAYDTYPANNNPNFNGLWSNFPYYPSGNVIGSGTGGLWVWTINIDLPCLGDADDNGAVDVDDLVAVILDWGTDGTAGGGDVDESGLVDVDDLVMVILAWGPCD